MRLYLAAIGISMLPVLALTTPARVQQTDAQRVAWNRKVPPFRVIGDIHYVGAAGVSAFLVRTADGLVLLDGGLPETAPQILENIKALGFDISNVKFLLNSHAHFDHAGGLALLKRSSGATMVASAADAPALRAGGPDMPAVPVDRVIEDGATLRLGATVLTANLMPGHTKGCTTWTTTTSDGGRDHTVLFHCSTSVVEPLVGNTGYPGIVDDYESTFKRLRGMTADVFLGNHPIFFGMDEKRARMSAGKANPFVDPGELARFVASSEQTFRAELTKQRQAR